MSENMPMPQGPLPRIDPELRRAKLALAVQQEIVAGGRVESQTEFSAVVRFEASVNHVLHLLLTLITFGFWIIVWIALSISAASRRKTVMLTVDEYGQGVRQPL
ncbi:hypothetical protein [Actinomycetospora termitidis]|uniref:Uncharacterized protein n=1 Tax=Actinomycetospora termitidis TaxID=3053470 RepID=A0ABT7MIU5_9PSEU|nr:hypothetical protein [Actinomycetospora sp. Odt1-22]MDL5160600.1 hypothetical protein [Actinomycetospora sp. Odt1-22]